MAYIRSVRITKGETFEAALTSFDVTIASDSEHTKITNTVSRTGTTGAVDDVDFGTGVFGRSVQIKIPKSLFLSLAEVEVIGSFDGTSHPASTPSPTVSTGPNFALDQPASQWPEFTFGGSYPASNAVDGYLEMFLDVSSLTFSRTCTYCGK